MRLDGKHIAELLAGGALVAALLVAVAIPLAGEVHRHPRSAALVPTVELTGVMSEGVWTDEPVTAASLVRRRFRAATPRLEVGKTVRLRLASADVVHAFASPGLGIDRTEVYPGRPVELLVTPKRAGAFEYYCTTVCGQPHFAMRGFVQVLERNGTLPAIPRRPGARYWLAAEERVTSPTARGAALYRRQGCVTCHGEAGVGGVPNPNSMNPTVPKLADMAQRVYLFTPLDASTFRAHLARDSSLRSSPRTPIPLYGLVRRQYLVERGVVRDGRISSRLAADGPRPPFDMPAWQARLSDADIDSILAFLIDPGRDGATQAARSTGPATPQGARP